MKFKSTLAFATLLGTTHLPALAAPTPAEEITTGAVSDEAWKAVPYQALAPANGVTLDGGLFRQAFDNNVNYLLDSFSTDDLVWDFRDRAGEKDAKRTRPRVGFWETDLRGSNAGRFMMGAGNAVRWTENLALKQKLADVVHTIAECKEANGYILGYKPDGFLHSEQANYARAWFTQGLCDVGEAGYPEAWSMLRTQYDWFNHCEYLPRLIRLSLGLQGHIASTRVYLSPIGKPEDLKTAEKYYVQKWWMDGLAQRDPKAVSDYKLDRPHSYEIVGFEAYLDHYRATGQKPYLDAMLGAWDIMHDDFEHVGGQIAICEGMRYPAKSFYIRNTAHTGELCGSVFWVGFNHRFMQLFPDQEKYANEIEKSIYNIGLANQGDGFGIRYHARLHGRKDGPTRSNTCCEGQGTRLYGSLPKYIYSTTADGLYVNLFESSTITFQQGNVSLKVKQTTDFPYRPDVALSVSVDKPVRSILRVRIPSWATGPMVINVNGAVIASGTPGTYQPIDRTWKDGDEVRFTLPIDFKVTQYEGVDRVVGNERYWIEYGPVLMAVVGPIDSRDTAHIFVKPSAIKEWIKPILGKPLRFSINGDSTQILAPYFDVGQAETFDCVPNITPITITGMPRFVTTNEIAIKSFSRTDELLYTVDGSEPLSSSPRYSGPVKLDQTAVVKARLFNSGVPASASVAEAFTKVPLFTPSVRYTKNGKALEIVQPLSPAGSTVHYTVDGNDPTEKSETYSQPIPLPTAGTQIRARAFVAGIAPSDIALFTIPIDASQSPWIQPTVRLPDLQAVKTTVGWNTLKMNKNILGKDMKLGGRLYASGVGVHAKSELIYAVEPSYKRFVSVVGIDDETADRGSVSFEVYCDDKQVYVTSLIRGNNDLWHINVAIPAGTKQLRLVMTDGDDDYNYDFGDWADAGFVTQ